MTLSDVEKELGPWRHAPVERIICHWTAGIETASPLEKEHYHWLIQRDLRLVKGLHTLGQVVPPPGANSMWPQHTRQLNTGSIGVSLCGMAGATVADHGPYAITAAQMEKLAFVCAVLVKRYELQLTEKSLLVHADVGRVYGIIQHGKWDISFWPGMPEIKTAAAVAHELRLRVRALLLQPAPA